MITENLSTLKIHKLTQAQYDRELEAGRIDENALYLTPDTEDESANVIIDLEASNEGKANLLNADTLNGKTESSLHVAKAIDSDRLGGVLAEEYVRHTQNMPKAGFIYPLATDTIPEGFLLCDGAAYSRTEYPELFAAIGTMYGAGDGNITFNVPNLQTRVPVGAGEGYDLGDVGGEKEHTLTVDEMPSHIHNLYGHTFNWGGSGGVTVYAENANAVAGTSTPGNNLSTVQNSWMLTKEIGNSQSHNNMQPYTVVNYIIATGKNTGISVADIVTGVQALPLGVEYGGTGATNIEDARTNLGITPENIGAMSNMELLWKNASPSSDFSTQTLSINTHGYSYFIIHYKLCASYDHEADAFCFNGKQGWIATPMGSGGVLGVGAMCTWRSVDSRSSNQISFGIAHRDSGSSLTRVEDESMCVPIEIYGVKGVSV